MKVETEIAQRLDWLSGFYASCGYGGRVQDEDKVFYAVRDGIILGVVRLSKEQGVLVLRGMQVVETHRGEGIGSALLRKMRTAMDTQPCFCLPYADLKQFYGAVGFQVAKDPDLPEFLVARKRGYIRRGMDVIGMVRQPAEST